MLDVECGAGLRNKTANKFFFPNYGIIAIIQSLDPQPSLAGIDSAQVSPPFLVRCCF